MITKKSPKAAYIEKLQVRVKLLESIMTEEQLRIANDLSPNQIVTPLMDSYFLDHPFRMQNNFQLNLLSLYFNYGHYKFPFLDEQNFMQNIRSHPNYFLNSMYALAAVHLDHVDADTCTTAGDFYYKIAEQELKKIKVDKNDYYIIGAYLLLTIYCAGNIFILDAR